eukprot:10921351-Karenia_brevis.AAC.1
MNFGKGTTSFHAASSVSEKGRRWKHVKQSFGQDDGRGCKFASMSIDFGTKKNDDDDGDDDGDDDDE